ncbi:MAG: hypothetical protein QXS37_04200 [Candidatus Aenigmatarchaeota archaeon]
MREFVQVMGIFVILATCLITVASAFYQSYSLSNIPYLNKSWGDLTSQVSAARQEVEKNAAQLVSSGNIIDAVRNFFGLAFSGVYYVLFSLITIFFSIPAAVISFVESLSAWGIHSTIVDVIALFITTIGLIKVIEFFFGRKME